MVLFPKRKYNSLVNSESAEPAELQIEQLPIKFPISTAFTH